jgi:(S)-3,5-dihydroxyphenylglycine transaminase
VGLTGAALLARVPAIPVDGSEPLLTRLERTLEAVRAQKRRARALYLVPDFNNPTGTTLTLAERRGLLEIARAERLLLIEDTAYRAFRYQGDELPTLKALDTDGLVVQVGSFSKLFMPGPRFGYLYADQRVSQEHRRTLAEEVAKAKSFVSVLTSPLVQATVGGFLIEQQFTLRPWNRPRIELCKASRDTLLETLDQEVGADLRDHVRWSRPEGGFFLTCTLPFEFGHADMLTCARDYGLIVCPLRYFSAAPEHTKTARLSFSNLTHDDAREGAKRWARFVREELARRGG